MKWIKGNKQLSRELAKSCESLKLKHCYDNVFFNLSSIRRWEMENQNPIHICFGYISLNDDSNVAIRHCFLEQKGEIIDPTLTLQENGFNEQKYVIMKSFNIEGYLEALNEEMCTDLSRFLRSTEQLFQQELFHQGFVPIG